MDLVHDAHFCPRCGAAVSLTAGEDTLIGRVINGAYRIEQSIGVGGMGRVYRANQTMLGRTVAIKVIHQHLLGDEASVARFYTEARAASRLNHPNSVSIIDFGRTDDGLLHLVMEYLHGKDLAMVMQEEGLFSFARICRILESVLAALEEAHELSVVHRDLKPENIILQRQRRGGDFVKVVDFGLAKILEPTATSVTSPGLVCGTPDYMSPEQARGEDIDGRGDLYSVGVLLFELLTGRLPFEDETPTKVALRHITEPVPDPRQFAPLRNIPDKLVQITLRALSKDREARYATADDMAADIREAFEMLEADADEVHRCPACAASVKPFMKYCADCGMRLGGAISSVQPVLGSRPPVSLPPVMSVRGKLVGRTAELERFEILRTQGAKRAVFVQFVGEVGMGKTRILSEVADRCAKLGDVVIAAGPHPSGAPVPYWAVRGLISGLMGITEDQLSTLVAQDKVFNESLAKAGLHEVVQPNGIRGLSYRSRAGAVAHALAASIRTASAHAITGRVILLIDDLGRCDALSREVIGLLPQYLDEITVLVVVANDSLGKDMAESKETITLKPLREEEANQVLSGTFGLKAIRSGKQPGFAAVEGFSPLYIEQMRGVGMVTAEDDDGLPRLSDIILQRIERLDVAARRVLQAAAVLGERCSVQDVSKLIGDPDVNMGVDTLLRSDLLYVRDSELQIAHPFLRDLVEASIPAAARMDLHAKALKIVSAQQAPLEVRAEHASRGGEFMTAMVLLERMGGAALKRGSPETAVYAFRHGLELARRELWETGDVTLDSAIIAFSRKLGEALEVMEDYSGADGVLREALDLAPATSVERARMLNVLGRVGSRRDRRRDAIRLLGSALEIANGCGDAEVTADTHVAISRVRLAEGDQIGAANALRRAWDSVREQAPDREAELAVRLAETLIDIGDVEEGQRILAQAYELAAKAEAPALMALVLGVTGAVDEMEGQSDVALERYKKAAAHAADAGDAEAYLRWKRASATLNVYATQQVS
ncbi:MAG: protein kinase [Myxococcales bacterium]|nr:protein kinase [Myxococcales bacterium]